MGKNNLKSAKNSGQSTKNNKKTQKAQQNETAAAIQERIQKKRSEIQGVVFITMGILSALFVYVISQSPFGAFLSSVLFGLVGVFGFAVPVLFLYLGVASFSNGKLKTTPKVMVPLFIYVLIIQMMININSVPTELGFFKYLKESYVMSSSKHFFGGMFGAILACPLVKLLTRAGANIVCIASLIILTIITFNFSITDTVRKLKSINDENMEKARIRSEERKRRAEEYDDDYYDDEDVDYSDDYDDYENADSNYMQAQSVNVDEIPVLTTSDIEKPKPLYKRSDTEKTTKQIDYQRPPYSLLKTNPARSSISAEEARLLSKQLVDALASYGVSVSVSGISIGPTVTRFEVQLAEGVRISKITSLNKDIEMALAASKRIRIEAPIPGKKAVGIEVPNKKVSYVYLRDILESEDFQDSESSLTIAVGKDIVGKTVISDIATMPHLMIAGSTGTGKSVCLNTILMSLVYKSSPDELRFILVDPKMVEFTMYEHLPHLLIPVVTDAKKAASALKWAVAEMTRRYEMFSQRSVRDLKTYNARLAEGEKQMPRIVIIIDELAELMMSTPKEVEESITRLAQLGRASGIHLIVATQRPSVDIITGKIKANIVSRIAFAVSDAVNSKVILDTTGAETLMGNGDMLFHPNGVSKPKRVQGAFVSTEEVEEIIRFFEEHYGEPQFDDRVDAQIIAGVSPDTAIDENDLDEVFFDAARTVISSGRATTSYIQNVHRIGYNRADRIISDMEKFGIVSAPDINKKRTVLVTMEQFEEMFGLGPGTKFGC